MPCDYADYGPGWRELSERVRFGRGQSKCEWPGCQARHGESHPVTGSRVVLTLAHLPVDMCGVPVDKHDKAGATEWHTLSLCNLHHLRLDHADHVANARRTREAKRAEEIRRMARVQPALELGL